MKFEPNQPYHVYNRGNDKQKIFFTEANYIYFLQKVKNERKEYCDVICYCLMPNHFHFMLLPNEAACENIFLGGKITHIQNLSKTIGKTLSSYTQAINIQNQASGALFQKKTKAKLLTEEGRLNNEFSNQDYLLSCFHYIHLNPLKENLARDLKDWAYSSYPDYYGYRNGALCNKAAAMQLLSLSEKDLSNPAEVNLNDSIIKLIY